MKKTIIGIMILIVCILSFASCNNNIHQKKTSYEIKFGQEYIVGIEYMDLKTKGRLKINEDRTLHFKHQDPSSVLNGMEEIISNDKITVQYKGLKWESKEADISFLKIKTILDSILETTSVETKKTSIRGIETYEQIFEIGNDTIYLHTDRINGEPIEIYGSISGQEFSIHFSSNHSENTSQYEA